MFILQGCGQHSSLPQDLDDYRERLANVLDVDAPKSSEIPPLAYPSIREMKADIPELSIKLNEFYAIQDCTVATLIAERNTALGRTQLPSTRYVYEVRLIEGLQQCHATSDDVEIREQLAELISIKKASLPIVWADMFQTSTEMRFSMSSNQDFLSGDENDNVNAYMHALTALIALQKAPNDDSQLIESALSTIKSTPLLARAWRSQRLIANELDGISEWLIPQLDSLQCHNAKSKKQVTYLNNVFNLFFIERIQPLAGALNSYQYKLIPLLATLQALPHIDHKLKEKLAEHEREFSHYKTSMSRHIKIWQKLLKGCNLAPTSAAND